MRKLLTFTAILALSSVIATAGTIHVPFDEPTIQAGIDAAVDGDTVLVSPGTYTENIDFSGKRVVVTVSDALSPTTIEPADPGIATVKMVQNEPAGTELSGFILTGANLSAIECDGSSPLIKGNIFTGNNSTASGRGVAVHVVSDVTDMLVTGNTFYGNSCGGPYGAMIYVQGNSPGDTISYNLFYGNSGQNTAIVTYYYTDTVSVHNNTIDVGGVGWGLLNRTGSGFIDLRNNIIFGSENAAVYTIADDHVIAEYNCVFDNNIDFQDLTPGAGNIFADARLVDTANHDYHLMPNSPCIDAGDLNPVFIDPDDTRNDIGAFPHLLGAFPYARMNFGPPDALHIVDQTPNIFWMYFDATAAQTDYIIQVGTDDDWTAAEMWDTGPVSSTAKYIEYAGAPLLDGHWYYIRLRVSNGISWGDWDYNLFRMNTAPAIPVPISPTNQAEVPSSKVRLVIANSSDPEGDSVTYDFSIFEDAGLSVLFDYVTAVPAQPGDTTFSEPFSGFAMDTEYWWVSRAWDGYEYTELSEPQSFIARDSCTLQLPGDADNDGDIDQADADYIYAYLCEDGPAPPVLANGDADGDCDIDNLDVFYIEAYLGPGPPPVACTCVEPAFGGCFQPCNCWPGESNNDGAFGIGDVVFVVNYIFKNGPEPVPYETCSCDFNGDCDCNISDVVAGINYIFKGGPPSPSCDQWRINCGWPLYQGD